MSPDSPHNQFGASVGAKIRAARLAKKLTQSQLASPDFSVSYISAIERGQIHPSIRALEILAGRLSLSSTQLLPSQAPGEAGNLFASGLFARGEDEVDLVLTEIQVHLRQGVQAQALTQLQKLVSKNLKRPQQAQVRYLLGWAYFDMGHFHEAETALTDAVQASRDLNNTYISSHILHQLGMVYAAMHNYVQAIQTHQRCLDIEATNQEQDPFFMAQVYAQLGQHYTHLNKAEQAVEMLRKAIAVTEEQSAAQNPKLAYWHMCQYYTEVKEYQLATLYAYKCLYLYNQPAYVLLRSELYHYLYHALMKIDQEQARAQLEETLKKMNASQEPLVVASITAHLALWFFSRQALTEAEQYAQKARTLSAPFGDTIIAAETLLVLGRIAYTQNRLAEGDAHFDAGLDMLGRLGAEEEQTEEEIYYSQLLEQHGKDREAFIHMKRAYESRQKLSSYNHA